MLRLLHTSDWHLGHQLHDLSREAEHDAFLEWLLDQIDEHQVDALLIAGDVFHTANPSAAATSQWYDFLATARDRFPALDVVAIAGNHDSAARIEAPAPLLPERHTIVGRTHKGQDGSLELDRLLVPLHDGGGTTAAWLLAVPFLRPQDLPPDRDTHGAEYLVRGTQQVYGDLVAAAGERAGDGQAIVAMGHMHMVAATVSEGSERRVFGGAEHVPADTFDPALAYVALGHLHKPQKVGGQPRLRYSGSPIPLSMDEEPYRHQVVLVELEGNALTNTTAIPVPRTVDVLRIPKDGPCTPSELGAHLEVLPDRGGDEPDLWPYLELRVELDEPSPSLRSDVDEALTGKAVRLVRIAVSYPVSATASDDDRASQELSELRPEDLFQRLWAETHDSEPSATVIGAFHELVDQAGQREGGDP